MPAKKNPGGARTEQKKVQSGGVSKAKFRKPNTPEKKAPTVYDRFIIFRMTNEVEGPKQQPIMEVSVLKKFIKKLESFINQLHFYFSSPGMIWLKCCPSNTRRSI